MLLSCCFEHLRAGLLPFNFYSRSLKYTAVHELISIVEQYDDVEEKPMDPIVNIKLHSHPPTKLPNKSAPN